MAMALLSRHRYTRKHVVGLQDVTLCICLNSPANRAFKLAHLIHIEKLHVIFWYDSFTFHGAGHAR